MLGGAAVTMNELPTRIAGTCSGLLSAGRLAPGWAPPALGADTLADVVRHELRTAHKAGAGFSYLRAMRFRFELRGSIRVHGPSENIIAIDGQL